MYSLLKYLIFLAFCAGTIVASVDASAEILPEMSKNEARAGFILASGDTLKFDILDDDKEPVDLLVASDGTVQAPFLGSVAVAGLTVDDARERLKARYVEQKIFVAPQIGLSVATYRPIFVLGDVKQPGAYPFQSGLTVEKAMGLAGGQLLAGQGEDPVLSRSRLHGELDKIDTTIVREALAIARLKAQIADRDALDDDDIPREARAYIEGAVAETMRAVEQRILETDRSGFAAQKAVLLEGVAEAQRGQELLKELEGKVNQSIGMSRADLDRGRMLQQRGIKTLSDVSNLERQLNAEEARQLQVLSELSNGRQELGTLKQQLAGLEQTRKIQALTDLQAHTAELAGSIATRRSTEEQLMLISALSAQQLQDSKEVVLDFVIRRSDGVGDVAASRSSSVEPGDVVVVSIRSTQGQSPLGALGTEAGRTDGVNVSQ
jgi:exopolysaccharide production protein ExoF